MGMRVTTGMAMNRYRYNLQNSTRNRDDSMDKVLNHRKFTSYAEAPAAATQAWRVRRAMVNNANYLANNSDTLTRFDIAHSTMLTVSHELTDLDGRKADIYAANDPTATGRPELGKVLSQTAESVIQAMNGAKSGENFVFAGNDELNAPFTWNSDHTILYYRGVDVNSGGVKKPTEKPSWADSPIDDETGLPEDMPATGKNAVEDAWIAYYRDSVADPQPANPAPDPSTLNDPYENTADADKDDFGVPFDAYKAKNGDPDDPTYVPTDAERLWAEYYIDQGNAEKLKRMSEEEATIDLGMGMLEDDQSKLVTGTYYDRSLPGINMLGWGVDEDGDPKNVCMIMKKLGDIYSRCSDEDGKYASDQDYEDAMRLMNKLKAGQSYASGQAVDISAKASFLKQNDSRLTLQGDYLNEQLAGIEDVDLADAIQQFSWDYYCYSAALKVGTQLLSQSLIDYMT